MMLMEVHDQPRILLVWVDEQLVQELYDLSLLMLVELNPEMMVGQALVECLLLVLVELEVEEQQMEGMEQQTEEEVHQLFAMVLV